MTWTDKQTCPITDERAKEALPKQGDYREIICPTCERFRISDDAANAIAGKSRDEKAAILGRAKAKAAKGTIPLITTYDF